ncbi:oligosaccharide flippase family protein [Priestia filamentosa]|uniref:oligosaccharide flippase family protein n=1 Tax=Priestia filamentosa TaxID=1402861 RepID=UPI003979C65F
MTKKISIYFVGMLSSKILSVLLIPLYAFYVSTTVLGYYDYIQTIMSITIPIAYIAIWEAILKFILAEEDEMQKKVIISTSTVFSIVITLVLVVSVFITLFLSSSQSLSIILLITVMFATYALALIWQYMARSLGANKVYVFAGIISTILNFIAIILLVCITKWKLEGLFIAYIVGQFSIIIFIEKKIAVRKYVKIRHFNTEALKNMIKFSFPLVFNLISIWLMSAFGRFIITHELDAYHNGLFSFASKFSLIVTMVGSVITMAIIEEAIISTKENGIDDRFKENLQLICRIFQSLILIAVPIIVIFYAFIKETDYYSSLKYAPWLLIYAVANTVAANFGSVFQAINKTRYQFTTTAMGAIVTVVVSYVFISSLEIYAVILGQILGSITMLFTRYLLINRYINFKISWYPIIGMAFLFIIVTMVCLNTSLIINIFVFIITIAFSIYLNISLVRLGYDYIFMRIRKDKG